MTTGNFGYAGDGGRYWSSRAEGFTDDSGTAQYLEITDDQILPSFGGWSRWYGRSLRCLSTAVD